MSKKNLIITVISSILFVICCGAGVLWAVKKDTNYNKYDVLLVDFGRTKGREIYKTRPAVVVSPNSINSKSRTVVVVPLTSSKKPQQFAVKTNFNKKDGQALVQQIRTIDKSRVKEKLGHLTDDEIQLLNTAIQEFFNDNTPPVETKNNNNEGNDEDAE